MEERNLRRSIQGVVVSNKNDKTIGVLVETHKKHGKYGKRVKYRKKYYAHDEKNECKLGDVVTIVECRKLSATKRYRLVSIDKTAELSVKEAEAELKEEILTGAVEVPEEVKEAVMAEAKAEAEAAEAPKTEETPVEEPKAEEPAKEEKVASEVKAPAKKPAAKKETTEKKPAAAKKPAAKKTTAKKEAE